MILTETNASEMARRDVENAVEFEGAYFHGNEVTYASSSHDEDACTVFCVGKSSSNQPDEESCGWERTYAELNQTDVGYYEIPPLCPNCYVNGRIGFVRTDNPHAKAIEG